MSNLESHDILEVEEIFQIISVNTLLLQVVTVVTLRPWGDLINPVFLVCRSQGMESGRGDMCVKGAMVESYDP